MTERKLKPSFKKYLPSLLVLTLLTILAFSIYWPVLNNTLVGDDYFLAKKNGDTPLLDFGQLSTTMKGFIRPLPNLVWGLQYRAFSFSPWPSHLINMAIHIAIAYVLFWFLKKFTVNFSTAAIVSILFVLTPIAPEAVTWSAGRYDSMAVLFIMLSMGFYITAVRGEYKFAFAGSMLFAAAALLSKESAISLIIIIPFIEILLFGDNLRIGQVPGYRTKLISCLIRLAIFFSLFASYLAIRMTTFGNFGGYNEWLLLPDIDLSYFFHNNPMRTISTIMAPLNKAVISLSVIYIMFLAVGLLSLFSIGLVIFYWKQVPILIRRLWILLIVVSISVLWPVYAVVVFGALGHTLTESRFLYAPTICFIALLVVGLLEFGRENKKLKYISWSALLLLIPVYMWGLYKNNTAWENASSISYWIPQETKKILPDPPPDAKLYFDNIPQRIDGAITYNMGLPFAIRDVYGRQDLQIKVFIEGDEENRPPEIIDGYLFVFDNSKDPSLLLMKTGNPLR